MQAYVGSIWAFGFNYTPVGWLQCNGQILPISQFETLFSLIGTYYGGDGQSNFALPNLVGRLPIGTGQGPGLSNYLLGQTGGSETTSLTTANLPPHTHAVVSAQVPVAGAANAEDPTGNFLGTPVASVGKMYNVTGGTAMGNNNGNTDVTGNGTPFGIQNPYQVINYCICVDGMYPPHS